MKKAITLAVGLSVACGGNGTTSLDAGGGDGSNPVDAAQDVAMFDGQSEGGCTPNPGAYDFPNNGVDEDCDGVVDNPPALCDTGIASDTTDAKDFAKTLDICQTTTTTGTSWGLIDAAFTLVDGTGVPVAKQHAVRSAFGVNVTPRLGSKLAVLSTNSAAAQGDTNPSYEDAEQAKGAGGSSPFPADFLSANGGKLPNAPNCPAPAGNAANDPVMLTLTIRVPTNAKSFTLHTDFFSSEYPEWVCSAFNDFFAVLLDSTYAGASPNPTDKNIAVYFKQNTKIPAGVNLAFGNTGLFTQCVNGTTGCSANVTGTISTCVSTTGLTGTGLDTADPGLCDSTSLEGGATGWLAVTGNVVGGEVMKLRIALWNTSDEALQSLVTVDRFEWSPNVTTPGMTLDP